MFKYYKRLLNDILAKDARVPANDAATTLFLITVGLSCVNALLFVWASLGHRWVDQAFLPIAVTCYVFLDACYAVATALSYRYRVRLEMWTGAGRSVWRFGEHVGAGFIALALVLPVLVSFRAKVPGLGTFQTNPSSMYIAAGLTITILALSSAAKMFLNAQKPRLSHNRIIFNLCIISTISLMTLITNEAAGGSQTPTESFWLYVSLLAFYASHNMALSLRCPQCHQRSLGHLAALSVGLFTIAILLGYAFGALSGVPMALLPFLCSTALILTISVDVKYLQDRLRKFIRKFDKQQDLP